MSPKICFAMDWVLPQNTGKQTSGCHEDLKVKFPSLNIGNYRGTILGVASFNEGNIFGEFFCFFSKVWNHFWKLLFIREGIIYIYICFFLWCQLEVYR